MTKERWDKIKDKYPQFTKTEFEWIVYALSQTACQKYFEARRANRSRPRAMLLKHADELSALFIKLFPTKEQEYQASLKS